jgi:hypothetical protein
MRYLSGLSVGDPYTILVYIIVGMVGYHPTQRPLALLSLRDPINHACVSTKSMLTHQDPKDTVLNRLRRGLSPSELQT